MLSDLFSFRQSSLPIHKDDSKSKSKRRRKSSHPVSRFVSWRRTIGMLLSVIILLTVIFIYQADKLGASQPHVTRIALLSVGDHPDFALGNVGNPQQGVSPVGTESHANDEIPAITTVQDLYPEHNKLNSVSEEMWDDTKEILEEDVQLSLGEGIDLLADHPMVVSSISHEHGDGELQTAILPSSSSKSALTSQDIAAKFDIHPSVTVSKEQHFNTEKHQVTTSEQIASDPKKGTIAGVAAPATANSLDSTTTLTTTTTITAAAAGPSADSAEKSTSKVDSTNLAAAAAPPQAGNAKVQIKDLKFRGVKLGVVGGVNVTRLSLGLYNLIIKYKIRSLTDVGCHNNVHWFPQLVQRLEFDVPNFVYNCVEDMEHADLMTSNQEIFGQSSNVEYYIVPLGLGEPQMKEVIRKRAPTLGSVSRKISEKIPDADMYFSWRAFHEIGARRTWQLLKQIRSAKVKYVAFGNNRGYDNDLSQVDGPMNVFNVIRAPFHFSTPMKVLTDLTNSEWAYKKAQQLVFYNVKNMRPGVL